MAMYLVIILIWFIAKFFWGIFFICHLFFVLFCFDLKQQKLIISQFWKLEVQN